MSKLLCLYRQKTETSSTKRIALFDRDTGNDIGLLLIVSASPLQQLNSTLTLGTSAGSAKKDAQDLISELPDLQLACIELYGETAHNIEVIKQSDDIGLVAITEQQHDIRQLPSSIGADESYILCLGKEATAKFTSIAEHYAWSSENTYRSWLNSLRDPLAQRSLVEVEAQLNAQAEAVDRHVQALIEASAANREITANAGHSGASGNRFWMALSFILAIALCLVILGHFYLSAQSAQPLKKNGTTMSLRLAGDASPSKPTSDSKATSKQSRSLRLDSNNVNNDTPIVSVDSRLVENRECKLKANTRTFPMRIVVSEKCRDPSIQLVSTSGWLTSENSTKPSRKVPSDAQEIVYLYPPQEEDTLTLDGKPVLKIDGFKGPNFAKLDPPYTISSLQNLKIESQEDTVDFKFSNVSFRGGDCNRIMRGEKAFINKCLLNGYITDRREHVDVIVKNSEEGAPLTYKFAVKDSGI